MKELTKAFKGVNISIEIIDDEKTGLLFEAQNFNSLAYEIKKLINDKKLLAEIAKNGKIKCEEKFSNELQFKKLTNILKELAGDKEI